MKADANARRIGMSQQTAQLLIGAALILLVGGAIYLASVRGPAILLDLAAGAAAFLCL